MMPPRGTLLTSTAFLLVGLTAFAAAAGVFVRDVGATTRVTLNVALPALGAWEIVFNAYELTYTLVLFSTVQVDTFVQASFSDWRIDFGQSNGSSILGFRPQVPGVHRIAIVNLEVRDGLLGATLEQRRGAVPEFELSLLDPLLLLTATSLAASVSLAIAGRPKSRRGRQSLGRAAIPKESAETPAVQRTGPNRR